MANCIAKEVLFKSGFNVASGLTFQLDLKKHGGITYLDTPGLADVTLRETAAKAITEALKKNGTYQIFFVTTLESGRIRPEDMATIKLVLDSAPDIKDYSLIINKLSLVAYNKLIQEDWKQLKILVAEMTELIDCKENPPTIFLLKNQFKLHDVENEVIKWDELDEFAKEAPCTTVTANSVRDILDDPSFFKTIVEFLMESVKELRKDREKMARLLKEIEEKYQKLMDNKVIFYRFLTSFYLSQQIFDVFFLTMKLK